VRAGVYYVDHLGIPAADRVINLLLPIELFSSNGPDLRGFRDKESRNLRFQTRCARLFPKSHRAPYAQTALW